MNVTINTDASFFKNEEKGSFAYWIVSNQGKIQNAGILKGTVKNPDQAELKCIVNAFYHLTKKSGWSNITKIIINTDSMNCIDVLTRNKKEIKKLGFYRVFSLKKNSNKELQLFFQLKSMVKIPVELKHVKSHQKVESSRQYVNDWCDTQAKKVLRDYVKKK